MLTVSSRSFDAWRIFSSNKHSQGASRLVSLFANRRLPACNMVKGSTKDQVRRAMNLPTSPVAVRVMATVEESFAWGSDAFNKLMGGDVCDKSELRSKLSNRVLRSPAQFVCLSNRVGVQGSVNVCLFDFMGFKNPRIQGAQAYSVSTCAVCVCVCVCVCVVCPRPKNINEVLISVHRSRRF